MLKQQYQWILFGLLCVVLINGCAQSVKDGDMGVIFKKYCSGPARIDYKNTDYSKTFLAQMNALKLEALLKGLVAGKYPGPQMPEALQYLGLKLLQADRFDEGFKLFESAATHYYDLVSMYRVARIYKNGTNVMRSQMPSLVIKHEIKPDLKKAYFWVCAIFYVDRAEKTGLLSTETSIGWNTIAMLDELQMQFSQQESIAIEKDVLDFIRKRYPEIVEAGTLNAK